MFKWFIHTLAFLVLIFSSAAFAELKLADPTGKEQMRLSADAVVRLQLDPEDQTQSCSLKKGARGTIVARQNGQSLVAFNREDWQRGCGKTQGVGSMAMAWVSPDKVDSVQAQPVYDSNKKMGIYGDRCEAFEFLEQVDTQNQKEKEAQAKGPVCDQNCSRTNIMDMSRELIEMTDFHFGNRCFIEGKDTSTDPVCSFAAMLAEANDCSTKKGKEVRCPQGECERRLSRQACLNSPWRGKPIEDRFQLIMNLSKKYAPEYGVDPRAMPCIATVETGYLEPMAKTLLACGNAKNERMNRYHGLGMLTLGTLEVYLSPYKSFKVSAVENGKRVSKTMGPFRSKNPLFQKPSYYACPAKLHDALGASPELQIELMAYTLAEKMAISGGKEHAAYSFYNGHTPPDPENGRSHMLNYADAVQACVSCLRTRFEPAAKKSKGKQKTAEKEPKPADPVECLSAATRGGTNHHFHLAFDEQIRRVFDGSQKRYCGEGN